MIRVHEPVNGHDLIVAKPDAARGRCLQPKPCRAATP